MLCERAQAHPERPFTRFDRQTSDVDLTYGEAWALACRWAALFKSFGFSAGRKVLLALPNGADFVGAFFGASLAGLVPAPSIPRRAMDLSVFASVLSDRVHSIDAAAVVTSPESGLQDVPVSIPVLISSLLPETAPDYSPPVDSTVPGLLQFTSATSGHSKAVQLSQEALLFQASNIAVALNVDPLVDLGVSWLPLFHDMGLVGFLVTPLAAGMPVFLLRTEAFASRPTIWMATISRERGTHTSGPPSAYALASRFAQRSTGSALDLSSLRIALIGGERIMPGILNTIHAGLGPAGLSWSSLMPAYGMAEVGLAATITPAGRGPHSEQLDTKRLQQHSEAVLVQEGGHGVVGCGVPLASTSIQVVDDEGQSLPERCIGQIMIKSPSVMMGHLQEGKIDTSCIRSGWLSTGDRGYLSSGELFVTGRVGELLHIGGAKYLPEEFEEAVVTVEGVRNGRVVAVGGYSEETSTETPTLIIETVLTDPESRTKCVMGIRHQLMLRSLPVGNVVFVPPKTIERTPNGKLPRARFRERLLRGEFNYG